MGDIGNLSLSGKDERSRRCTYRLASGEMLRPKWDELQRKRSTSVRLSIKNVSVGIEDDQIPL